MTSEAMPEQLETRVVRLPLHDKVTGLQLRSFLEIDVNYFITGITDKTYCQIVELDAPDPTPEQEQEIIDRIISGLPMQPVIPDGVILYDVASLHPQEYRLTEERKTDALIAQADTWELIPEFENYAINPLGVIRNRWTKRVIEVAEDGGEKYVAMHDKHGFEHDVNVRFAMEKTYGTTPEN